jgi:hypothetical protein
MWTGMQVFLFIVGDHSFDFILISRRSRLRAGTRYRTRGVDDVRTRLWRWDVFSGDASDRQRWERWCVVGFGQCRDLTAVPVGDVE